MKNSLRLILILGFMIPTFSLAKENPTWQQNMQELSKTLTDVFPFLYSRSEFREPKNKAILLKNFERLNSIAHELPASTGQGFVGSEPLFNEIKTSVKTDLIKAKELLKTGSYESAQQHGQAAIQKCFGCHTAIQIGPKFPPTNSEIMNISTPFKRGKIVAFGAIRQFRGALEVAERSMDSLKENDQKIAFAKLYMIVSLRALQDFDGSEKLLDSLEKSSDEKLKQIFNQWRMDIKSWRGKSAPPAATTSDNFDLNFIRNLHDSLTLHSQTAQLSPDEKAKIFYRLARVYQAFGLTEFNDLPKIYYVACTREKASTTTKEPCVKALKTFISTEK